MPPLLTAAGGFVVGIGGGARFAEEEVPSTDAMSVLISGPVARPQAAEPSPLSLPSGSGANPLCLT